MSKTEKNDENRLSEELIQKRRGEKGQWVVDYCLGRCQSRKSELFDAREA